MAEKSQKTFKQKTFALCQQVVNSKLLFLQQSLQDLIISTNNETKSSAGDKYETGRAMLQIQQDNVRKQLKEVLQQKAIFEKIDRYLPSAQVIIGSLVKTDKGLFFMCIGLGRIMVEGVKVIAVSAVSPLGSKLIGRKTAESVTVNGTTYTILSVT
ncbi:MAG: GreA/GreB family elongation factor [Bacteroidota bacterium]|nr:GreA/GreB family elongation factor [Bacteroidota bacterium]